MERIRLTQRMAARNRQADSAEPPTSIDLGKNRTYRDIDQYHTFEPSLNHWEPDMRHEWKEDKHDETGFGIPKMAKVYMAAKKATKLAMMLLGENAPEATLENQARAFMRMGDKALTASIERWAQCTGENCDEEPKACIGADEEEAPAPAETEAPAEAPAEAEAPVAPEAAPAETDAPVEEAPAPADTEAPAETEDVAVDDAPAEGDVDLNDEVEDGADTGADKEIESVFEDEEGEEPAPAPENTTASKKSGLKKLAGQPTLVRVASKNADDLAGIWDKWSNPDVR